MSVDHTIGVGYGFIVTEEQAKAHYRVVNPEDDTLDYYDGLEGLLKGWPTLGYFTAGSYYDDTPVEYAVILNGSYSGTQDLAGFLDFGEPDFSDEQFEQMDEAYETLTEFEGPAPARWVVGGLWH